MVTLRPRRPKKVEAAKPASVVQKGKKKKLVNEKIVKPKERKAPITTTKDEQTAPASSSEKLPAAANTANHDNHTNNNNDTAVLNEFLDKIDPMPSSKRQDITWLHNFITSLKAPNLQPELQGKATLAYGGFEYKTKSGCAGRWSKIGIMVNKTGLSLMISAEATAEPSSSSAKKKKASNKSSSSSCPGTMLLEQYDKKTIAKKSASSISVGKSCIRFKKLEDLNLDVIQEIISAAAAAKDSSIAVSSS